MGTTAASTSAATSTCSGEPCDSESMCRSQWGHCGSSADYCNAQSLWRASGCTGASASTTTTPQASAAATSSATTASTAATTTLLSHEQEITLGRQVQELVRLEEAEAEFKM